jgi:hypothetical protein
MSHLQSTPAAERDKSVSGQNGSETGNLHRVKKLLALLLSIDLLLLILAIVYHFPSPPELFTNPVFSLETEGGLGELFQHFKELLIVSLLFAYAIKNREPAIFIWGLILFYLGLDDSFQFHEKLGAKIDNYFQLPSIFHLRPVDLGELIYAVSVGVPLSLLAAASLVIRSGVPRKTILTLASLVALFIFFGVVMDMVAIIANDFNDIAEISLSLLEDFGEMVTMSIILGYTYLKSSV